MSLFFNLYILFSFYSLFPFGDEIIFVYYNPIYHDFIIIVFIIIFYHFDVIAWCLLWYSFQELLPGQYQGAFAIFFQEVSVSGVMAGSYKYFGFLCMMEQMSSVPIFCT